MGKFTKQYKTFFWLFLFLKYFYIEKQLFKSVSPGGETNYIYISFFILLKTFCNGRILSFEVKYF